MELVAEGEPGPVGAYLEAVEEALGRYIGGAEVLDEPATGEFRGFGVGFEEE